MNGSGKGRDELTNAGESFKCGLRKLYFSCSTLKAIKSILKRGSETCREYEENKKFIKILVMKPHVKKSLKRCRPR